MSFYHAPTGTTYDHLPEGANAADYQDIGVRPSDWHYWDNAQAAWVEQVRPTANEKLKAELLTQIAAMERAEQLPRVTRESIMAFALMLAQTQGIDEPTLYASNIAYRKTKDFDTDIASLRDQASLL